MLEAEESISDIDSSHILKDVSKLWLCNVLAIWAHKHAG